MEGSRSAGALDVCTWRSMGLAQGLPAPTRSRTPTPTDRGRLHSGPKSKEFFLLMSFRTGLAFAGAEVVRVNGTELDIVPERQARQEAAEPRGEPRQKTKR